MKHVNAKLAVIGGTGLHRFDDFAAAHRELIETPFGGGVVVEVGAIRGMAVAFLARHGERAQVPPHKVNYRANLWALRQLGVSDVIAINAVGGITEHYAPRRLAIPDQIIDYSYGRDHTYFERDLAEVVHVDFTQPYTDALRHTILRAGDGMELVDGGTYGVTQGPRLETTAEIKRLRRDGCDMVGMTAMPEAVLVRELGLRYASIAMVANWAAGVASDREITMDEIRDNLLLTVEATKQLLPRVVEALA